MRTLNGGIEDGLSDVYIVGKMVKSEKESRWKVCYRIWEK